jgi:hypothetical protein
MTTLHADLLETKSCIISVVLHTYVHDKQRKKSIHDLFCRFTLAVDPVAFVSTEDIDIDRRDWSDVKTERSV